MSVSAGAAVFRSSGYAMLELTRTPGFRRAAAVAAGCVLVLLALHLAQLAFGNEAPPLRAYALDRDRGGAELFEYMMSADAAFLLLLCFFATRQAVYAALAGTHLWLLSDNALQLHERLGARLEVALASAGGPALGESLVFLTVMLAVAAAITLSVRSADAHHGPRGLALAAVAGAIAVFAVGVDLVHGRAPDGVPFLDQAFVLLEDGGELALFALNAAFAFAAYRRVVPAAAASARAIGRGFAARTHAVPGAGHDRHDFSA